jgi:hypothetical protein
MGADATSAELQLIYYYKTRSKVLYFTHTYIGQTQFYYIHTYTNRGQTYDRGGHPSIVHRSYDAEADNSVKWRAHNP